MPTRSATPPSVDDERTVMLARRRFARRQWARRWLVWRRLASLALLLAAAGGLVWLFFFSSLLAVAAIRVDGVDALTRAEVREVAAVPPGQPLATVDLDAVTARLEGLAAVQSVDVARAWPDTVHIRVSERVPVAVVSRDGVVRGVDANGVVFRSYDERPADLPVVRMSAATTTDALAEAATVVEALPGDLADRVSYVEVDTVDTISLRLQDGRTVFWGSADESELKAKVIHVLLEQKARTYDVSVPGQPTLSR